MAKKLRLIFTTFPVSTETFLAREVEAMVEQGVELELWSLWGGDREYAGVRIERPHWACLFRIFYWLPYWMVRKPKVVVCFLGRAFFSRYPSWLNYGENLLGMGMGLVFAHRFEKGKGNPIHGVWATGPTAMAWVIAGLTEQPFSFGAHAFDLFELGGDRWLNAKISDAEWVRSSTEQGCERILEKGGREETTLLVRRGLLKLPEMKKKETLGKPIRILGVGRMVEKMGYEAWVETFKAFIEAGKDVEGVLIGGGPDLIRIEGMLEEAGLGGRVKLLGEQPYSCVESYLQTMDVLLFTGKVSENGDRAGFPNILGEAMAYGLPIIASRVGGVCEVIEPGKTGWLADTVDERVEALEVMIGEPSERERIVKNARTWVEASFDVHRNVSTLLERFR